MLSNTKMLNSSEELCIMLVATINSFAEVLDPTQTYIKYTFSGTSLLEFPIGPKLMKICVIIAIKYDMLKKGINIKSKFKENTCCQFIKQDWS